MAFSTRSRVSCEIARLPLITYDTVEIDTPAACATSAIVTMWFARSPAVDHADRHRGSGRELVRADRPSGPCTLIVVGSRAGPEPRPHEASAVPLEVDRRHRHGHADAAHRAVGPLRRERGQQPQPHAVGADPMPAASCPAGSSKDCTGLRDRRRHAQVAVDLVRRVGAEEVRVERRRGARRTSLGSDGAQRQPQLRVHGVAVAQPRLHRGAPRERPARGLGAAQPDGLGCRARECGRRPPA